MFCCCNVFARSRGKTGRLTRGLRRVPNPPTRMRAVIHVSVGRLAQRSRRLTLHLGDCVVLLCSEKECVDVCSCPKSWGRAMRDRQGRSSQVPQTGKMGSERKVCSSRKTTDGRVYECQLGEVRGRGKQKYLWTDLRKCTKASGRTSKPPQPTHTHTQSAPVPERTARSIQPLITLCTSTRTFLYTNSLAAVGIVFTSCCRNCFYLLPLLLHFVRPCHENAALRIWPNTVPAHVVSAPPAFFVFQISTGYMLSLIHI